MNGAKEGTAELVELRGAKHSGVKNPFIRGSRCKLLVLRVRKFLSGAKENKRELSEYKTKTNKERQQTRERDTR